MDGRPRRTETYDGTGPGLQAGPFAPARPAVSRPGGARIAVWLGVNVEHYAYGYDVDKAKALLQAAAVIGKEVPEPALQLCRRLLRRRLGGLLCRDEYRPDSHRRESKRQGTA